MTQLARLAQPFAPKLVHAAPQGKYGDYVSHDAVTQKLLAVLGPFSFHVDQIVRDGDTVTGVVAMLTVTIDGREVTVTEVGDVENPDQKKTNGARLKDAMSDAVKRCAMRVGCGLHLWADSYFLYDYLKDSDVGANPGQGDPAASEGVSGSATGTPLSVDADGGESIEAIAAAEAATSDA